MSDDDKNEIQDLVKEVKLLHSETTSIREKIIVAFNEQEAKIQLEKEKMNV